MTRITMFRALPWILAALGVACSGGGGAPGDGAAAYSETISLRMSGIKNGDVHDGQASVDKSVGGDSMDDYKIFLRTAHDRLGRDPSAVVVRSAVIRIYADTRGVNSLDEVFGSLELYIADSSTTIPIGSVSLPAGTSQDVVVTADEADLDALQDAMLHGSFKVGVRGPVVASPPSDFDLRLTVDIVFAALP